MALSKVPVLEIEDLHVSVEGREILKGLSLSVQSGEVHALMGPNGSGKSTLSNALMGHPRYQVTSGQVKLLGEDILGMKPNERAERGLFLAMQYPTAIPGLKVGNFLKHMLKAARGQDPTAREFRKLVKEKMDLLEIDPAFLSRYVNDGFSGGEKKRHEILQLALLEPKVAILDETDSGLDIDALKTVSTGINKLMRPEMGLLLITHYQRILNFVKPDRVHVMIAGRLVRSGGEELSKELEARGYEWLQPETVPASGR